MQDREALMAKVAQPAWDDLLSQERVLLVNDLLHVFSLADASRWNRYAYKRRKTLLWPEGTYDAALIRLHPNKTAMEQIVHAVASVLVEGGAMWIVGGNDEGIKSWPKRLLPYFERIETVDIRKRCRLVVGYRNSNSDGLKDSVSAWWQTQPLFDRDWYSLPGCFAKGALDRGTELLLSVLDKQKAKRRVLDFACGTGVLSFHAQRCFPDVPIDALDFDAYSVEATRKNVPGVQTFISDGWHALPNDRRYDLILSNPPLHFGKKTDHTTFRALLDNAKNRLFRKGALIFVVQRQLPVPKILQGQHSVEMIAENSHYWVWKVVS
ncbi:MAG: methyltransferase [Myxococcota bacterium]|nr:methyltransferase [Myxococcota bacterium]